MLDDLHFNDVEIRQDAFGKKRMMKAVVPIKSKKDE